MLRKGVSEQADPIFDERWVYHEHSKVKHAILEKYLSAWIRILGSRSWTVFYFDGFAGRGEYAGGLSGSPVIALRKFRELSCYYRKAILYFIEKDEDNFSNLENVINREDLDNNIIVKTIKGEFSEVVGSILDYVHSKHSALTPSFFFIDPFGFSGVPFDLVKRLMANPSAEVFFTFMARDINRFISLEHQQRNMDRLFGTHKWEGLISLEKKEGRLLELYRAQLHDVASTKYSSHFRVCSSDRAQTIYYLIHTTNNFTGHRIMKDIMYKQGVNGQFAYLGPNDISGRSTCMLFEGFEVRDLKKLLAIKFKGEIIAYDSIHEHCCHPWFQEPPYIDSHFRTAIKELEAEGRVVIERITSKKTGLAGKDNVHFL